MSSIKPKVKFVKNMEAGSDIVGICLFWIHEIHIDERHKNGKSLPDLIRHEQKHYRIIQRILATKSPLLKLALTLYNNVWDYFDVARIVLKYPREYKEKAIVQCMILPCILYILIMVVLMFV